MKYRIKTVSDTEHYVQCKTFLRWRTVCDTESWFGCFTIDQGPKQFGSFGAAKAHIDTMLAQRARDKAYRERAKVNYTNYP